MCLRTPALSIRCSPTALTFLKTSNHTKDWIGLLRRNHKMTPTSEELRVDCLMEKLAISSFT